MDPVAHTLVGAALAESGLKKLTRYATPTLLIGVNLPDIDALAMLWGEDTSLYVRRGWSHGILAMVVLPVLLVAAVLLWHRWRGRLRSDGPPLHLPWLVTISFIAVWSHPLLDWLNTYGIRLLMPFDDTWFYGDTLFIIDPWVWLLAATGVVLARSASRPEIAAWVLLGGLASALILTSSMPPLGVKLLWVAGVAAIVALRWWRPSPAAGQRVAQLSFAALVMYVCAAYGLARLAESTWLAQDGEAIAVQANPTPGVPSAHRLVVVHDDYYQVISADGERRTIPRESPSPVVARAMADPSVRGFMHWSRFLYWEVIEQDDYWRVIFRDLRYLMPDEDPAGIGHTEVRVPKD
ncbi:metal-dependent hydrolase [Marinimicrobium alkaliphilum]|uniref:metal-dependent hydrolase n=1 Tax=Marinimicrobium alkaliphilum TaxID=2202654 RepID=UPI000DB98BBA|nr:metal-dependent hydrolase [Marinimicrobium alkaliphilum]